MAMTTLGADQPSGKMTAEAAVLDVHIHCRCSNKAGPVACDSQSRLNSLDKLCSTMVSSPHVSCDSYTVLS